MKTYHAADEENQRHLYFRQEVANSIKFKKENEKRGKRTQWFYISSFRQERITSTTKKKGKNEIKEKRTKHKLQEKWKKKSKQPLWQNNFINQQWEVNVSNKHVLKERNNSSRSLYVVKTVRQSNAKNQGFKRGQTMYSEDVTATEIYDMHRLPQ